MTVRNEAFPDKNVHQETSREFHQQDRDWGFSEFMPVSALHAVDSGYLVNDTFALEIDIAVTPPAATDKVKPKESNSKGKDGRRPFVGLVNLGATCYLNSLVQTLFHIRSFRRSLFAVKDIIVTAPQQQQQASSRLGSAQTSDAEGSDPPPATEADQQRRASANVSFDLCVALQRLFYDMQCGTEPANPRELVQTFGWKENDLFQQHDVQEVCRMLLDRLSTALKGTSNLVDQHFKGTILHTVECTQVEFRSALEEDFYDIQLNVKGCKNIYDSFAQYTSIEVLDGDNRYHADSFGLQAARKAAAFKSFPTVLFLHLRRFEFDGATDRFKKVNDSYEFYDTLTLDPYLMAPRTSSTSKASATEVFRLHSVLVHSGSMSSGHYVAFSCPDGSTWHKFDDRAASTVAAADAISANFGGSKSSRTSEHGSSAYMLVYVKKQQWNSVQSEVRDADIPPAVRERILRIDPTVVGQHSTTMTEQTCEVYVVTPEHVASNTDPLRYYDATDVKAIKVLRSTPFRDLQREVASVCNVEVSRQLYWLVEERANGTVRPSRPVLLGEPNTTDVRTVETVLRLDKASRFGLDVTVFMHDAETLTHACSVAAAGGGGGGALSTSMSFVKGKNASQTLIIFKIFRNDDLVSTCARLVSSVAPLKELWDAVGDVSLGCHDTVEAFEELRPSVMDRLDVTLSTQQLGLDHGDIILVISKTAMSSWLPNSTAMDVVATTAEDADDVVHSSASQNTMVAHLTQAAHSNWSVTGEDDVMCNLDPSALVECTPAIQLAANVSVKLCSVHQPEMVVSYAQLPRILPMTEVQQRIAVLLRIHAHELALYATDNPHTTPLPIVPALTLRDVLGCEWSPGCARVLYFAVVQEVRDLAARSAAVCPVRIATSEGGPLGHLELCFYVTNDVGTSVLELVQGSHVFESIGKDADREHVLSRTRLVEVGDNNVIQRVFVHTASAAELLPWCTGREGGAATHLRLELVHEEDVNCFVAHPVLPRLPILSGDDTDSDKMTCMLQLVSTTSTTATATGCFHSAPCFIAVTSKDTFETVRNRYRDRLKVSVKDAAEWSVCLAASSGEAFVVAQYDLKKYELNDNVWTAVAYAVHDGAPWSGTTLCLCVCRPDPSVRERVAVPDVKVAPPSSTSSSNKIVRPIRRTRY